MGDILPYLGVEQSWSENDPMGKPVTVPDLTGLTAKETEKLLKSLGLGYQSVGTADQVTGQLPVAGKTVPGGSEVLVYFGEALPTETVTVPDFNNMYRQQAADAAAELGLYMLVEGNTSLAASVKVQSQDIAPGTQVPRGSMIKLKFLDTKAAD
jgi:stage V sporulation protein D (sporulation-specific penicillin-binding protein)